MCKSYVAKIQHVAHQKDPNAKTQQTTQYDPTSCRGEDPTAQRSNTLHNKIQPYFYMSYRTTNVCSTPLQTMNSCTQRPNTLHQSMSEPLSRKSSTACLPFSEATCLASASVLPFLNSDCSSSPWPAKFFQPTSDSHLPGGFLSCSWRSTPSSAACSPRPSSTIIGGDSRTRTQKLGAAMHGACKLH